MRSHHPRRGHRHHDCFFGQSGEASSLSLAPLLQWRLAQLFPHQSPRSLSVGDLVITSGSYILADGLSVKMTFGA